MTTKIFLLLNVLTLTLLATHAAIDLQPYKDSFEVVKSKGFSHVDLLQVTYDAEKARKDHGMDLSKIANSVRYQLSLRHGYDWHCFVNIGETRCSFFAKPSYVYLKSDSGDNMHIVCFKTPWVDVPGTVRVEL